MPQAESAPAVQERCSTHPGRSAVGNCDRCGRPACLDCAVPVRGQIIGPECISDVLGSGSSEQPDLGAGRDGALWVALGLSVAAAVFASILPWTHASFGAGMFGGWGWSPLRWSLLSSLGAVSGAALALAALVVRRARHVLLRATLVPAAVVVAGAGLHIWHPPAFTDPWLGPWVALGAVAGWAITATMLLKRPVRTSGAPS